MRSILHEPLVHFLVLGGLIFGVFLFIGDPSARGSRERIEVTEVDAARLAQQFEAAARRPPSQADLSSLLDRYIQEEVLVREARALSLDRDDKIIRQRLTQKMQLVIETGADATVPTDTELRQHFEENAEKFAAAPLVAFKHLLLGSDTGNADAVLSALRSGADPGAFAHAGPLPQDIPPVSRQVVDGTFGEGFFARLAELGVDQWSGPIRSAYGLHLIRVTLLEPGHQPPFEEIREKVEKDWQRAKAQRRYEEILSRYEIKRPDVSHSPAR